MSMVAVAGQSPVHPSIAKLTDEGDEHEPTTAVDPIYTAAIAAKMVPRSGLASSLPRPNAPRPRTPIPRRASMPTAHALDAADEGAADEGAIVEPEPELLHTMDFEVLPAQPLPSVAPPPLPVRAAMPLPARERVRRAALRTAVAARVVAFFVAYVAMALVRWMLRAVPHVRAFATASFVTLRAEWQRASERGRALRARG